MARLKVLPSVLVLAMVSGLACGPAAPDPKTAPGAAACASGSLSACEDAIARALKSGDPVGPLVVAYADARERQDGDDPLPALLEKLEVAATKRKAVLVVPAGAARPATDALVVEANAGFKPTRPDLAASLYVAIAEAAGLDYLAIAEDGDVRRYFPRDPLAPLMIGLVPTAVDRGAPPSLATDAALESAIRESAAAAKAFRYRDAAKAIDRVDALLKTRPTHDAQTLRGKVLSSFLGFSKPTPMFADTPPPPEAPAPTPSETPYVDLLRVRTDPTNAKAYEKRRARILEAVSADLRPAVDALFSETPAGCDVVIPPRIMTVRELAFARLLPAALKPARARAAQGRLDIGEWYPRYGELVATIERHDAGYLLAPALMAERGGASGVTPSGSDIHRRASKIALTHARALGALASTEPGRVGFSHTAFLAAPGNYADAELAAAVVEVGRSAASGVLTTSTDPWEILGATLASAFVAFSMPPELREAHLTALQGAFTSRLRGELVKQTGWGVAAAFAVDALYRLAFDLSPDLPQTADQIGRALEADGTELPGLAALTSALVRYGALAQRQGLGTPVLEAASTPLPARAAAKAALAKAVARLGDGGPPPSPQALEDLTSLLDGAAATLAFQIAEGARAELAKPPAKSMCASEDAPVDPRVVRALGKLADQRRKILESKAIATGTDAWSKRARAIALVVSDMIDVAQASAKPAPEKTAKTAKAESRLFPRTKLYVKRADATVIMKGAAESFGLAATGADATASGYALLRAFVEGGADALDATTLAEAKTFVASVGTLLAESREMAGTGALFSVLGRAIGSDASVTPLFVGVSKSLYEKGERQQADMVLLLALVVASVGEQTVHPSAIALAEEQKSDVAWVLKFLRETKRLEKGERTEPASFGPGLDALLAKKCSTATSRAVTELIDAVDKHRSGDRDAARMALDAWLDRAEKDLSLPRVSFAFKQETETRVFHLTLEVGLGGPMLQGSNSFTFGAGAKSAGEPLLSLQTAVDSVDSKRARDDAARTFVHAAAVAGVMHFLAGDNARGEVAAARAISALTQRTRLYVQGVTDEPIMWADGARGTLAILAQQASDAGRPFLSGALLEMVRSSVGGGAEPSDFAAVLDPLPHVIQHMPGITPVVARAKKTLEILPGGLPCGGRRSDKAALMKASCDTYANALALRIADATAALPKLEAKGRGAACADFAAVDAFLQPASRGTYDPDRLQAAAKKLLDADKVFDAAVLLTRQRQPNHCSAPVIALVRTAAARLDRVASTRADLLSAAVNCEASSISPALVTDIGSLDTEIERIGDSSRQLEISLFAAKLALTHGSSEPLAVLVGKPDFVSRQRETGPGPLGFALLLDHASSALAGQPIRIKETASDVELLCGRIPPPDRAELCKLLEPLRVEKSAAADRRKAAEAALRRLLGP